MTNIRWGGALLNTHASSYSFVDFSDLQCWGRRRDLFMSETVSGLYV